MSVLLLHLQSLTSKDKCSVITHTGEKSFLSDIWDYSISAKSNLKSFEVGLSQNTWWHIRGKSRSKVMDVSILNLGRLILLNTWWYITEKSHYSVILYIWSQTIQPVSRHILEKNHPTALQMWWMIFFTSDYSNLNRHDHQRGKGVPIWCM